MLELEQKGISSIPCVGVGVSVWNDNPVLLRLETNPAMALDVVNRALRAQPQTVRRDLQAKLTDEGYAVRLYVPYGDAWYPYFMRRLAERPANVLFILRNLFRE